MQKDIADSLLELTQLLQERINDLNALTHAQNAAIYSLISAHPEPKKALDAFFNYMDVPPLDGLPDQLKTAQIKYMQMMQEQFLAAAT